MSSRTGSSNGGARQTNLERQIANANKVGANPIREGAPNPRAIFAGSVLGGPVDRTNDVAPDLQGKYLGRGTYVNANKGFFNTKQSVLLTPNWASALNARLASSQGQLEEAARQGIQDFSLGIAGTFPGDPVTYGYYVPGIKRYYADDRARLTVSRVQNQNVDSYLLPGSTAARAAGAQGYAIGLTFVKNPKSENKTGYLRVGSKGYRDALKRWALGSDVASDVDMHHLFGQGAVYGLGPIYRLYGIDVVPVMHPDDPRGLTHPVRYRVTGPAPLNELINNRSLMRSLQAFYDANFKNPDQMRLGQYGAASLFLRHADKMNTSATGGPADPDAVNQAVLDAWGRGQSAAGRVKWGRGINDDANFADFANRRGLTAFPLRDARGNPVRRQQSTNKNAGGCNIWGSGPGVTDGAYEGGKYGFRFTKGSRNHASTKKGEQGVQSNQTYKCLPTPDFTVNPNRAIYQAGENTRATADKSLAQVLNDYGNPNYSAEDLESRYADWAINPEKYGTTPYFMLNPATGRAGFSAPVASRYYSDLIAQYRGAEAAKRFNETNLTQEQKILQSNRLYNEMVLNAAPPQFAKTS